MTDGRRVSATDASRGQVVVVAAAVLALALVAMSVAFLQLGYHGDVRGDRAPDAAGGNAVRLLERAAHEAARTADGKPWTARTAAARAADRILADAVRTLETARAGAGVAVVVSRNESAAGAWAVSACPGDPDRGRVFGSCVVEDGLVFQERAGEGVLVAAGFDVRVVTAESETDLTVVVRTRE